MTHYKSLVLKLFTQDPVCNTYYIQKKLKKQDKDPSKDHNSYLIGQGDESSIFFFIYLLLLIDHSITYK